MYEISNVLCGFGITEKVHTGSTTTENKPSLRWVFHVNKTSLAKCTGACDNCRPTYRLIKLPRGSSETMKMSTEVCKAAEESVFNCNSETYNNIPECDKAKESLAKLIEESKETTYSDKKRRIKRINEIEIINDVTRIIEDTLKDQLNKHQYRVCNPTLLNTKQSALRQQAHYDFDEETRKSSMFGIIAFAEGETIYVFREEGIIDTIQLGVDTVFVGFGQCVHAGSETRGKRLHFKFKESGITDKRVQVNSYSSEAEEDDKYEYQEENGYEESHKSGCSSENETNKNVDTDDDWLSKRETRPTVAGRKSQLQRALKYDSDTVEESSELHCIKPKKRKRISDDEGGK